MVAEKQLPWVEKYRPSSLDDYIFESETLEKKVRSMVRAKDLENHLMFSGVQGTGKTTLAQVIIKELNIDPADVLTVNASKENSIDDVRNKINSFVSTFAIGSYKIVHLEEVDGISPAAQKALRFLMDEYTASARFILACNYANKIIPALKSRIHEWVFKSPPRDLITERVATILLKEKIKFDLDLLDKYVAVGYPDIRKTINMLEQNCIDGVLGAIQTATGNDDYKFKLLEAIEANDLKTARETVCQNVGSEEWEDVYRFLYENLNKAPKFKKYDKWEEGIVIIADHLHKHGLVADPEINAAAMFIRLGMIK